MKSEILKELEDNVIVMTQLINKQIFSVGDANKFLNRYSNIVRKLEDLEKSRDNWKRKYDELKEKMK